MFKFFLIMAITAYILFKIGSFLFKIGAASQQFRNNKTPGNIHGNAQAKKGQKKPNINGDYIDYEEVK